MAIKNEGESEDPDLSVSTANLALDGSDGNVAPMGSQEFKELFGVEMEEDDRRPAVPSYANSSRAASNVGPSYTNPPAPSIPKPDPGVSDVVARVLMNSSRYMNSSYGPFRDRPQVPAAIETKSKRTSRDINPFRNAHSPARGRPGPSRAAKDADPESSPPPVASGSRKRIRTLNGRSSSPPLGSDSDEYEYDDDGNLLGPEHLKNPSYPYTDEQLAEIRARSRAKRKDHNIKFQRPAHLNPNVYGHIPGMRVGKKWKTRKACSEDGVHAPPMAGVHGRGETGAFSVALCGGYEDDVDRGQTFLYSGAGGHDKTNKMGTTSHFQRGAAQTSDQEWSHPSNAALKMSYNSGRPVRVIRGYTLNSIYAPAEGYRYDGLYKIVNARRVIGIGGKHYVCLFDFERLPDQPRLERPWVPDDEISDSESSQRRSAPASAGGDSIEQDRDSDVISVHSSIPEASSSRSSKDKGKGKAKAKSRKGKERARSEEDDESEVEEAAPPPRDKGKRKAVVLDSEDELEYAD